MNGLDFGHVVKALGTFVNKVVGLFGSEGGDAEDEGEVISSEHWSHYGFDSRPHPEDEKGRCEVIFSRNQNVTICSKDRRYRINLKDGEVAIYTGQDGEVTCKQVLKPDGTVVMTGQNLGILMQKKGDDSGDVIISAENSMTLTQGKGSNSVVTIKKDGGIQAATADGAHLTLDASGKAVLGVSGASVTLDGSIPGMQKAVINAPAISIVGSAGVGISPVQMPVATVGCMAGPYPIAIGSTALKAQFP